MKTKNSSFGTVATGAFIFVAELGEWLVKTSQRSAMLENRRYSFKKSDVIRVIA